jgi:hypothetical protein
MTLFENCVNLDKFLLVNHPVLLGDFGLLNSHASLQDFLLLRYLRFFDLFLSFLDVFLRFKDIQFRSGLVYSVWNVFYCIWLLVYDRYELFVVLPLFFVSCWPSRGRLFSPRQKFLPFLGLAETLLRLRLWLWLWLEGLDLRFCQRIILQMFL